VTAPAGSRLAVGLRAIVTHVVGEADTAAAMGSGDVPVLGTPRLLNRVCAHAALEIQRV